MQKAELNGNVDTENSEGNSLADTGIVRDFCLDKTDVFPAAVLCDTGNPRKRIKNEVR
jgi:hypothetical protein